MAALPADTRLLILDEDADFAFALRSILELEGVSSDVLPAGPEALASLRGAPADTVLLDLSVNEGEALAFLETLRGAFPDLPVVVMKSQGSLQSVADAFRLNAFDYLAKPFDVSVLLRILAHTVAAARSAKRRHRDSGKESMEIALGSLVGTSPPMIEVFKAIARVAQTDATVLITGESGTGKELVAQSIHSQSPRSRHRFLAVNCGALSEGLLESELFGHVKGAFTDARADRRGLFESASGGTLFLDEVTETSPAFQVKLLRVLQERTVRPVGSSEERAIDVRVLAATNRPLEPLFSGALIRRDLLYRLGVVHIALPPLRERRHDIPLLARTFLKRTSRRQKKSVALSPAALDVLHALPWHGNVRELEHAIERAVTLNRTGEIQPADLLSAGPSEETATARAAEAPAAAPGETPKPLDDVIREHLRAALVFTGGNKLRAAELLGIGRWTLYRMARRLNVPLEEEHEKPPSRRRRVTGGRAV